MGKVSDVAKDAAKNKVKSVVLGAVKAALPYILIGIGIILLITLLIGLFMVVVSSIGDIVTDIVSAMGEFFSGIGNWFSSLFDSDKGKFIITINEDKFTEMKSALASQGINAEESSLTDECLKLFILAQYKTQYPEDVRIKIEVSDEEKSKIQKRGRSVEEEDGKYYLVAEGCIQLYRPEFNNSSKLKYTTLGELQEYENGTKSFDDVKGKYSIDNSGNLVIPQKSSKTTWQGVDERQENGAVDLNVDESEDVWEDFKKDWDTEETEEVTPSLETIPYQSMISSYTMPFEFLTILTTFTQNSEYGVAVAELVNNESSIKLQILDNSTTKEERQLYQYKSTNSVDFNVGAKAAIPEGAVWVAFDANTNDIRNYVSEYKMIWKPWNYEKWNSETYYIRRKVVAETEYKASIQLEEANTWYTKKTNTIESNTTTPEKDTSISPNPNIEDKNNNSNLNDITTPFINQNLDKNTYQGLQNLYDTNALFKKFIDEFYNKDTGRNGVKDFREDLLATIDENTLKSEMVDYVNGEVTYDLWKRFYEQVLGGTAQGYTTADYINVIGYEINASGHATVQQVNQYNKAVAAQDDYLNEDPNWKIDDSTYEVFPTYIANKREERKIKTTHYVSKTTYSVTSAGQAEDNTDAFLELLIKSNKYVEYKTDDGKKKPGQDLASAPDMLFDILAGNPKTANLENAMRYVMYRMTNEDYGVTDFGFSVYSMESFSSIGKMIDGTIQDKVWYALKKLGYSDYAIAGVMGNIHWESGGFNPSIVEGGTGVGFGLCQWSYGRRTQLESFAASRGKDPADEDIQIEFLLGEINPSGGADGYAGYQLVTYNGYSGDDWKNATSVEEATKAFCWSFERPGIPHMEERIAYAESYYNQYSGKNWAAYEETTSTSGASGTAAAIIAAAESKIGCPYVYGANGPNQFDCSGLVCWSYEQAGINIWGYKTELGNMSPQDISMSDAQPGDVLWKTGHVALCVSNVNGVLTYIEAPGSGLTVRKVETTNYGCFTKACRWIQ